MAVEPALRFWLDFAEHAGAVTEERHGATLVVLPDSLQAVLDVPDELVVTADPDIAREDDALLLYSGHPLVLRAAELVLSTGDAGLAHLAWPGSAPPGPSVLEGRARDQIAVDHGRIDVTGHPAPVYLPIIRMGARARYTVSVDEAFQEQVEAWVDGRTGLAVPDRLRDAASGSALTPGAGTDHRSFPPDLHRATSRTHALVEEQVRARVEALTRSSRQARERELAQVEAYYDGVLSTIAARRANATRDRQELLDTQAHATRAERARRIAETCEKFEPRWEIQPFRLHHVGVPALIVPITVRRGARSYPAELAWVLTLGTYLTPCCPSCWAHEPLVAGRERLGCRACLRPRPGTSDEPGLEPTVQVAATPSPGPTPEQSSDGSPSHNGAEPTGNGAEPPPRSEPPASSEPPARGAPRSPATSDVVPTRRARDTARARHRSAVSGSVGARTGSEHRADSPSDVDGLVRHLRRVQGVHRDGQRLAEAFWSEAAAGRKWSRTATVPHSPLHALYRLYGPDAPLRAVGVPPGLWPLGFTATTWSSRGYGDEATTGVLDLGDAKLPYTLRWRMVAGHPSVLELLPYGGVMTVALPAPDQAHPLAIRWMGPDAPRPRLRLDPVAAAVWDRFIGRILLPGVVRCLALWWRIQGQRELTGFDAAVLAAGIAIAYGRRFGVRATIADVAALYQVPAAAAGDAARRVEKALDDLGVRPW